jgi:hypothetical protein
MLLEHENKQDLNPILNHFHKKNYQAPSLIFIRIRLVNSTSKLNLLMVWFKIWNIF